MTDTNAIDFYHGQVDDQRVRLEGARSPAEIKIRLWLIGHYAAQIDVARRNGERVTLPRIR